MTSQGSTFLPSSPICAKSDRPTCWMLGVPEIRQNIKQCVSTQNRVILHKQMFFWKMHVFSTFCFLVSTPKPEAKRRNKGPPWAAVTEAMWLLQSLAKTFQDSWPNTWYMATKDADSTPSLKKVRLWLVWPRKIVEIEDKDDQSEFFTIKVVRTLG